MSAVGTKRTSNCRLLMSAFGGKADMVTDYENVIDAYLLYFFFAVQRPASMLSSALQVPQTPGDRPHDPLPSRIERSRDPFGLLDTVLGLLGYVIAIAGIAILAYAVSPAIRPLP